MAPRLTTPEQLGAPPRSGQNGGQMNGQTNGRGLPVETSNIPGQFPGNIQARPVPPALNRAPVPFPVAQSTAPRRPEPLVLQPPAHAPAQSSGLSLGHQQAMSPAAGPSLPPPLEPGELRNGALPFPRLDDRLMSRPDLRRPPVQEAIAPLALNIKKLSERVPRKFELLQADEGPLSVEITLPRSEVQTSTRGSAVTMRLYSRDDTIAVVSKSPETVWLADAISPQDGATPVTWTWLISALEPGPGGLALQLQRMVPTDDGRWVAAQPLEHKFVVTVAEGERGRRKPKARGRGLPMFFGLLLGTAAGIGVSLFWPQIKALIAQVMT
jgi:hypothetical protein